jgi:hypothetical protein
LDAPCFTIGYERGGFGVVELFLAFACFATFFGDPEVGTSGVEDDNERLAGGSDSDVAD